MKQEGKIISVTRTFIIVMDGVGVGALPDAADFGDEGANTLAHVLDKQPETALPTLAGLGLGAVCPHHALPGPTRPAAHTRSAFLSPAKDTITGHWELCSVISEHPLPTYPEGFPPEIIAPVSGAIGRPILGNCVASGTEILQVLGEESRRTGHPIVYTSADSVFQIAAHEEVVDRKQLYEWCQSARDLLRGEHGVGRVIARPFVGRPGAFVRTAGRRDFALPLPYASLLDRAHQQGLEVHAIGKVKDIFSGQGISYHWPAGTNQEVMEEFNRLQDAGGPGIIMGTLIDFDTLYGHRNDVAGFATALEDFDRWLHAWLQARLPGDLVVITADHGCDPTWPTTDHTREWVPVLVLGEVIPRSIHLKQRCTLADVGATVAGALSITGVKKGDSFWEAIT